MLFMDAPGRAGNAGWRKGVNGRRSNPCGSIVVVANEPGGRKSVPPLALPLPGRITMIDLDREIASETERLDTDLSLAQLMAPELAREMAKLRRYLVNYEDFLEAACLALLLGKHLYLYGAPGTAKSQACRLVSDSLCNCRRSEERRVGKECRSRWW